MNREVTPNRVMHGEISHPPSNLGRVRRFPHDGECTRPLYMLAVQCTMRTADESNHSAMGTLQPHGNASASCTLHCANYPTP